MNAVWIDEFNFIHYSEQRDLTAGWLANRHVVPPKLFKLEEWGSLNDYCVCVDTRAYVCVCGLVLCTPPENVSQREKINETSVTWARPSAFSLSLSFSLAITLSPHSLFLPLTHIFSHTQYRLDRHVFLRSAPTSLNFLSAYNIDVLFKSPLSHSSGLHSISNHWQQWKEFGMNSHISNECYHGIGSSAILQAPQSSLDNEAICTQRRSLCINLSNKFIWCVRLTEMLAANSALFN